MNCPTLSRTWPRTDAYDIYRHVITKRKAVGTKNTGKHSNVRKEFNRTDSSHYHHWVVRFSSFRYLGSGKTTLLKNLLTAKHGLRIAVIENENEIHKEALSSAACVAEIFETQNGCICCAGADDFTNILVELSKHSGKFDNILIETTGLADPAFIRPLFTPGFKERYRVDGFVTVVDAYHAESRLLEPRCPNGLEIVNEASEQVAAADLVIINKIDLVDEAKVARIKALVEKHNPAAEIIATSHSEVAFARLFNIRKFSLARVLNNDPQFLDFRPFRKHDQSIHSLPFYIEGALDQASCEAWLKDFTAAHDKEILRSKGYIGTKETKFVFQGVGSLLNLHEHSSPYAEGEPAHSKLIFIGSLDPKAVLTQWKTLFPQNPIQLMTDQETGAAPPSLLHIVLLLSAVYLAYPDTFLDYLWVPVLLVTVWFYFYVSYFRKQQA